MRIAFYISNHGFGHATRISALASRMSEWGITCYLITNRPDYLFDNIPDQFRIMRKSSCDFGIIQKDWKTVDIFETEKRLIELWSKKEALVEDEVHFLRKERIDFVISDIVPFAFEAAKRSSLPIIAISNFDWHYIYSNIFSRNENLAPILDDIKSMYQYAKFAIQLPFSDNNSMAVFDNLFHLGLLVKESKNIREFLYRKLNIPTSKKLVLLNFGGGDEDFIDLNNLCKVGNIVVLSRYKGFSHPNYRVIDHTQDYSSIIRSCDYVITKMGYSTLAECLNNGTFVIYSDRNGFPEDIVLRKELDKYSKSYFISNEKIFSVEWDDVFSEINLTENSITESFSYQNKTEEIARFILRKCYELKKNKYVVIDVGTNNVLLLWAIKGNNEIITIHRAAAVSGLGKGMKNSELKLDSIEDTKSILENYIYISKEFSDKIIITGSSCSRDAKNIDLVSGWIKEKFNLKYKILSEDEEAYYNGKSTLGEFSQKSKMIAFDVGGGSTEFTFISNGRIVKKLSIGLGLRRLENGFGNDLCSKEKHVNKLLKNIKIPEEFHGADIIGIGGTSSSLGAIKLGLHRYDSKLVHKSILKLSDIVLMFDQFNKMNPDELVRKIPFEPLRAGLLLSGVMVIKEILVHLGADSFFVNDAGLQYGILYEDELFLIDKFLKMT